MKADARVLDGSRILITRIPDGGQPFWVRRALLGLILPYVLLADGSQGTEGRRQIFRVSGQEVLAVLEEKIPTAALWWAVRGYDDQGRYFLFVGKKRKKEKKGKSNVPTNTVGEVMPGEVLCLCR